MTVFGSGIHFEGYTKVEWDNSAKEVSMRKMKVILGSNWMKLEPGFWTRLRGKLEYAVQDLVLEDGRYFLDRYLIKHQIHAEYTADQYQHPDFPHCVLYRIRISKDDEESFLEALKEMEAQSVFTGFGEEYQNSLTFIQNAVVSTAISKLQKAKT